MALDTDIVKQLVATFTTELEEKLQVITDGLFALENKKRVNKKKIMEEIFRAAHNIKGSARSIGITNVGEIAHHIESIFASIRAKTKVISTDIINLCLVAVDGMRSAMQSFCDDAPLTFDIDKLTEHLEKGEPISFGKLVKASEDSVTINPHAHETTSYETIRVSVPKIDHVSALVEELQINKIIIEDHYAKLKHLAGKVKQLSHLNNELTEISNLINQMCKKMHGGVSELGIITNSLQEEIRMLRLVPASTLLRHLTRSVRELAQELNKKIDFEISGDNVKMDQMILEGLKDPIIHLLRNAIDHGIEKPSQRKKNGKSDNGKITIDIIDEGNQILINISDDGVGIDCQKIAAIARKKNILSENELANMSEHSICELIFRPDFSTKEVITDVSGRGIGLDVVKTNLADLKGNVTFTTQPGKGTTFHLRVPLTLTSDIGLIIRSCGQLFVIPTSAVERVLTIQPDDIHEVEATQIILFEQKPISLSNLSDILALKKEKQVLPDQFLVVVLKKGREKVALLVDEIMGEREIVIKPLQAPLVNVPCVAGGTLSGAGEVIIVLNPVDILNSALHLGKSSRVSLQTKTSMTAFQYQVLLVEDSITTRTLEKNILESNNYNVTAVVNGKEAWDLLQKQKFSLVITDVEMPHMNGFELTERIKQSKKLRETPVIIVTSLDNDDQKKRGIEVGADAYIVKHDFESTELLQIVAQLV